MTDPMTVSDRMQARIAEWEAALDPRAVFLDCYSRMTRNVLISADSGEFFDAVWVRQLLQRFADYYFDALESYEADDPATPAVWRAAHDASQFPETAVLQKLLLGINAHINYDLVFAVSDLLTPEWETLDDQALELRFADHCHVNAVIGRTIDEVQDEVVERYEPVMGIVDAVLGPLDERITVRLISQWRDEVWQRAVQFVQLSDADGRQEFRRQVEASTLARADQILLRRGWVG